MTHYLSMFDKSFIGAWSLDGEDVVVTIESVKAGNAPKKPGEKKAARKAIVKLREFEELWLLNVTNGATIAAMYGAHVEKWVGKRVTLFPTTTSSFGDTVECIRVKPTVPRDEPKGGEKKPHAAAALAEATNPKELIAAIRSCAKWIANNSSERWPKVMELCEKHDVGELEADAALQEALS